jgi:outer membrane protein assembly factor BamE (lipoprotein component of BamABCDE complex)
MKISAVAAVYDCRFLKKALRFIPAVIDRRYSCILLAAALGLTACASKLTQENLDKIHSGMTVDEVKAVLGSPNDVESHDMLGFKSTEFVYHTKTADVKVVFLNDKVMSSEGSFQ